MIGMIVILVVVVVRIKLLFEELFMIYDKLEENIDGRLKDKLCYFKGSIVYLIIVIVEGVLLKYSNIEILVILDMERNNVDGKLLYRLKLGVVNFWDKYYCFVNFEIFVEINIFFFGF